MEFVLRSAQRKMKKSDEKSSKMIEKVHSGKPKKDKKNKTEKGVDTMFKMHHPIASG
jgi:hypothetical protein